MAFSAVLTDGTTEIDFVYDPGTQDKYRMKYGATLQVEDTQVLQHQPDNDEPVPIRGYDMTRTAIIRKDVYGDSRDDVLNQIAAVKRWVDGADQQALRHWTDGDVDRIDLKIQLDSATNYTLQPVRWGFVDDSGAFYRPETSKPNAPNFAMQIAVRLHLTAYGEGASFTLRNQLPSSPHAIEDSDSDGRADGFSAFGTGQTFAIATGNYLIGGSSQRIDLDASSNHGILTSTVAATVSSTCVAFCWIYAEAGTDPITFELIDGSNNVIDTGTFNVSDLANSDYDKTAVGGGAGTTYYRMVLSGSNTTAADFRMRVRRTSANASTATSIYLDGFYLNKGTTTPPAGLSWCSTRSIENRYDPTSSNEGRINYVDVWGIPGDSDALAVIDTDTDSSTDAQMMTVGMRSDGSQLAAELTHWVESSDFTISLTDWSSTSDGTRYGGEYISCAATAVAPNANFTFPSEDAPELFSRELKVLAVMYTTSTNTELTVKFGPAGARFEELGPAKPTAINTWSLVDVGTLNLRGAIPPDRIASPDLGMTITAGGSAGTVRVDAIILMPTEQLIIVPYEQSGFDVGDQKIIDGVDRSVWVNTSTSSDIRRIDASGSLWTLKPGTQMNRMIFFWHGDQAAGSTEQHAVGRTADVLLDIYPQTRHLLGTI